MTWHANAQRETENGTLRSSSSSSNRWLLLLVGLITVVLCLPFFRTVYGMGDEGVLLNGAERLLRGNRLYADFFEFLPPGGFFLTAAWFRITGISFGSARSLAILTIVGIACFTYLACRRASNNAPLSAILTTGWVVLSQGVWTQLSHHWLTTLFSMVAASATLTSIEYGQRRLWLPLISGASAGMALMITPHRGAYVILASLIAFLNLQRRLIIYVIGCALVPAGLLAVVIWQNALAAAFDDVIRFSIGRYAAIQGVPFGLFGYQSPLTYLFPLTALLTLLLCASDWRNFLRDHLFWQCSAFALAGFIGCFPRPDLAHISFATPLACPLLAFCMTQLAQRWRSAWWRYRYLVVVIAGVAIGLCVPSAYYFSLISRQALRAEIVPTPRGGVAIISERRLPQLIARIAATPTNETYFFYPTLANLSFLTARGQASQYDVFVPGYTSPSQYQDACTSVMRHASWVVIDRFRTPEELKTWFPAMQNAEPHETKRFEQALDGAFELVAQEGLFELRRRREGISDRLCAGIAE